MKKLLIIVITSFVLFSCGKKVTKMDPEFVGHWLGSYEGHPFKIEIKEDSKFESNRYLGGGMENDIETRKGVARVTSRDFLRLNMRRLEIVEFPHIDDSGEKIMVMEGSKFRWSENGY